MGQTLKLDREIHTIVGVLPSNADFPDSVDLWVLVKRDRNYTVGGFGRLKEGISLDHARQDLIRIHKSIMETQTYEMDPPRLYPLRERMFGDQDVVITILMLSAGILGTIIGAYSAYLMETNMGLLTEMPVIFDIPMDTLIRVFSISVGVGVVGMYVILSRMSKRSIMDIFRQTF